MNPIISREFFGILRKPRATAVLVSLAVIFTVLILTRWPSEGLVDLSGVQARQIFRIFAFGLLSGVLLLAPAFPATSIVREKQSGTLALLFNTPLSPASIYFGKFGGALLFATLLLLTSLPAAAACYAMGGVDLFRELGALYAVLGLLALECVALGLLVSTLAHSTASAVRMTYAAVFAVCFATLLPYYLWRGEAGWLALAAAALRRLSPLPVVMHAVDQAGIGSSGLLEASSGFFEHLLVSGVFTLAVMVFTWWRLQRGLFDRARPQGRMTNERSFAMRGFRRLMFLVDPQRRTPGIPWYLNPVMVKEFRTRRFGRLAWLLRLVAACAVISLVLAFAATTGTMDWGVETIGGLLVVLQVLLVVLITPSLAAGLISSEIESGGWDLLRTTPLSGWRLVSGKLFSVAWTLMLVLLATAPGYLVMIYIKPSMWLQVYQVLVCLLLTGLCTLSISAFVGSCFSKTASSTVAAYIVLMALYLIPLLVWSAREAPFGHDAVAAVLVVNPLGAALGAIETPGFTQYELLPVSWWVSAALSGFALVGMGLRVWWLLRPT